MLRPEFQRPSIAYNRLLSLVLRLQRMAQVVMQSRHIRLDVQRPPVGGDRFRQVAEGFQDHPQIVERPPGRRVGRHHPAIGVCRLTETALIL
jgi:hypothetical protein